MDGNGTVALRERSGSAPAKRCAFDQFSPRETSIVIHQKSCSARETSKGWPPMPIWVAPQRNGSQPKTISACQDDNRSQTTTNLVAIDQDSRPPITLSEPERHIFGPTKCLSEPERLVADPEFRLSDSESLIAAPKLYLSEPEREVFGPTNPLSEPESNVFGLTFMPSEPERPVFDPTKYPSGPERVFVRPKFRLSGSEREVFSKQNGALTCRLNRAAPRSSVPFSWLMGVRPTPLRASRVRPALIVLSTKSLGSRFQRPAFPSSPSRLSRSS